MCWACGGEKKNVVVEVLRYISVCVCVCVCVPVCVYVCVRVVQKGISMGRNGEFDNKWKVTKAKEQMR